MIGFVLVKNNVYTKDNVCTKDFNINIICIIFFFFGFLIGFRPTNGGRLIQLMRRGMRIGQTLFPLGIEPGIPRVRPWKELLATGAQAT